MTTRERTLAKFALPVMGLALLYMLSRSVVLAPIIEVSEKLNRLQETKSQKLQDIRFAEKRLTHYRELCDLIPAGNPAEAAVVKSDGERTREYLRQKVDELLASSGLTVSRVKPPAVTKGGGRGRKKRLDLVSCTVEGRGDLQDVQQFLLDTYKVDDLLNVSSVHIKPDKKEYSNKVDVTIRLDTLVVPRNEVILKLPLPEPRDTGKPDGDGNKPAQKRLGRLAEATLAAYDPLLDWRVFDAVRPKPVETASTRPRRGTKPPVDTGSKPDPARSNMILTGSMNDSVLVVNEGGRSRRKRDRQREYFRVGQEFDGGILEFVHRLGVVVRRKDKENGKDGESGADGGLGELWVYLYGESFSDSILLDQLIEQERAYRQIKRAMEAAEQEEQHGPEESVMGPRTEDGKESSDESGN